MADLDIGRAQGWRADPAAARPWAVASILSQWWHRAALLAILVVASALNCVALDREGYANTYYAAGVKSMLRLPSSTT